MIAFLLVVAVLAGAAGLVFSSQATVGTSLVGVACLLAICARIAQAHVHHAPPVGAVAPTESLRERFMVVVLVLCLFGGFAGAVLALR